MDWQARLSARRTEKIAKGPSDPLPKLTEPSFVGFVSDHDGHSKKIAVDESLDAIRNRLLSIVASEGIDPAHVHAQGDDDIAECRGLSHDTLRDWMRLRASCAVCCLHVEQSEQAIQDGHSHGRG